LSGVLVIVNPAADRGRAARHWPTVAQELERCGIAFEEAITAAPGEAVAIAQRGASTHDVVVAAGGDGTVHEVVNGLMRAGGRAMFGVIPLGSGDDFEKLLSPRDAVERLRVQTPKPFDVGRIVAGPETRYFANGMDIGFGAHGARNVQRVPRMLTGFGAYLGALLLTMVRYPLLEIRLQLDDAPPFALTTAMTAVMNGTTFGGSFHVCPDARPDDGVLDLLLVDAVGRLQILQLVPKILKGSHAGDPRLRLARAKRVRIESGEPLLLEADGEIAFDGIRTLDIDLLPGALRVLS
jgi:YegS/Rv2252/BmrU family lipid kinase